MLEKPSNVVLEFARTLTGPWKNSVFSRRPKALEKD
jgi:hypothetical protein